jgi:hypothetical protein
LLGVYNNMKNGYRRDWLLASFLAISAISLKAQTAKDVNVELRSGTGSNRFQLGEAILLELVFSSSSPNKYLEPCLFLNKGCFGFPICRFKGHWTLGITPIVGWEDLHYGCRTVGGPRVPVESHDLSAEPLVISFELTKRFQFNTPGVYTIRFSTDIGLDNDSNPIVDSPNPRSRKSQPHSVNVNSELQLEIVPVSTK